MKKNIVDSVITKNVVLLFEEKVNRFPNKKALQFGSTSLTYSELNHLSNVLAAKLHAKGAGGNSIIPLMAEKSLEMIVGIWGILKAGAAYMPIDLSIPRERVEYMVRDCGAEIVLAQSGFAPYFEKSGTRFVDLSSCFDTSTAGDNPASAYEKYPEAFYNGDIPAYVIYTSGSTGEPKGIVTLHSNIPRVVLDTNYIDIFPRDRILQLSNYAFDGSVFDIFAALLNGCTLIIPEKEITRDISKLARFIEDEEISLFFITTALFNALVTLEGRCLLKVRHIIFGGERVSPAHVKKAFRFTGPGRLLHAYGPTETTVFATIHRIEEIKNCGETIPIGKAITDTHLYILDENLNPLPEGTPGELYIAGGGVARGYLGSPVLTASRFIRRPHVPGGRIYKTGDIVKALPDGSIEFVGRVDSQVKIRGFRIEPGDIEDAVRKHRGIKEAVVLVKEQENHKQLQAFIVPMEEDKDLVKKLKDFLKKNLPYYMIPAVFIPLTELPVTANGKVDRKKLAQMGETLDRGGLYEPPKTADELILVNIFEKVLNISPIGRHDSFTALGGSSIYGMAVQKELKQTGWTISGDILLEDLEVWETALHLNRFQPPRSEGGSGRNIPFTYSQKQFLAFNKHLVSKWYTHFMVCSPQGFDRKIVGETLEHLTGFHQAFNLVFDLEMGTQNYRKVGKRPFSFYYIDLSSDIEKGGDPAELMEGSIEKHLHGCDPRNGPLLEVILFKTSREEHLLFAVNQMIMDGYSLVILLEDFARIYQQIQRGELLSFEEKTTTFLEWARHIQDLGEKGVFSDDLPYWEKVLSTETAPLPGRGDENLPWESDTVSAEIPVPQTLSLESLMLAALNLSLVDWTGERVFRIEKIALGRDGGTGIDLSRVIGPFANDFPFILDTAVEDLHELAALIRKRLARVPGKGLGYSIHHEMTEKRDILFNFFGDMGRLLAKLPFYPSPVELQYFGKLPIVRDYRLNIYALVIGETLSITMEFNKNEFTGSSMEELLGGITRRVQSYGKQ